MRRLRGDDGQVAGIEVVPFGVLTFVIGALFVTHIWAVIDAKSAAVAAAREGARTYVEGPADAGAARVAATHAAREALAGHGRDPSRADITFQPGDADRLVRCAPVTVTVRLLVPGLRLPWLGQLAGVDVRAAHRELVDPFRDGIPGGSACD